MANSVELQGPDEGPQTKHHPSAPRARVAAGRIRPGREHAKDRAPRTDPPGPWNFNRCLNFTWRHYAQLRRQPWVYLSKLGARYGDLCHFMLFHRHAYLVKAPDLIRQVLVEDRECYDRAKFEMASLRGVLGDSLLTATQPEWKQHRQETQQALREQTRDRQAETAVSVTRQHLQHWPNASGELDLDRAMIQLAMQMSVATMMGGMPDEGQRRLGDDIQEISLLLIEEMESILPRRWQWRRRQSIKAVMNRIRLGFARAARRHGEASLLRQLEGQGVSDELALQASVTMGIAANHTTSATLAWIWRMLLTHDDVYERAAAEARSLEASMSPCEQLESLGFIRQVIQESLRLYPSAWILFAREALEDTELRGYRIRKRGMLFISPFVTQRDETYFEDPLVFRPERFSLPLTETQREAYLPFGKGPHRCIGEKMAMTQMPLMIGEILRHFDVRSETKMSLAIRRDMAIRPKYPAMVSVRRR